MSPSETADNLKCTEALKYYDIHYDLVANFLLEPTKKLTLGPEENKICRFCKRTLPEVSFKKVAHAIPELLGNKSLDTNYECDSCNDLFGRGIENDLGKWTKPSRTFARIRGKNGVPSLIRGSNGGWRIDHNEEGFKIKDYEENPIFVIDEAKKQITFNLTREPYTPIAVLKAFVKIGLTVMPELEIEAFQDALAWVQDPNHSKSWVTKSPAFHTFTPGPMRNDLLTAMIMRRRSSVTNVPYSLMIISYGNEAFQVYLPNPTKDFSLINQQLSIPPFPVPTLQNQANYGKQYVRLLDLSGTEVVKGEKMPIHMSYENAVSIDHSTIPLIDE